MMYNHLYTPPPEKCMTIVIFFKRTITLPKQTQSNNLLIQETIFKYDLTDFNKYILTT